MIYNLYVYRDRLKTDFSLPMVEVNDMVMKRNFENLCTNDHNVSFAPQDYDLYCVGTFDTESGLFETKMPEFIVNGGSLV